MALLSDHLEIVIAVVVLFQAYVSLRIAFYGGYTRTQKAIQILIAWFVPLLGAVVVYLFLTSDKSPSKPLDTRFTPDGGNNPPGIQ